MRRVVITLVLLCGACGILGTLGISEASAQGVRGVSVVPVAPEDVRWAPEVSVPSAQEVSVLYGSGQGMEYVRQALSQPAFGSGARMEIRETPDAAAAVRRADLTAGRTQVTAYGVSLFRDNSQNAGANARAAVSRFAEMYPEIPVRVKYDSPWFTVEAGLFVDRTDAVALGGRVQAQFPKAVVIQHEVSMAEVIAGEIRE